MADELAGSAGPSRGPRKRTWIYCAAAAVALSVFATAIVLGNVAAGVPPQRDENAWAHLFQLAMGVQLPLMLLFLATADWAQKPRVIILFGAQIVAAAAAFSALARAGY